MIIVIIIIVIVIVIIIVIIIIYKIETPCVYKIFLYVFSMYTLYMLRTLFLDHAPRDLAVKAMSLGVENWADGDQQKMLGTLRNSG